MNTLPPVPPQQEIDYDAPPSDDNDASLLVVYLVFSVVVLVLGSLGYIVWSVTQWQPR